MTVFNYAALKAVTRLEILFNKPTYGQDSMNEANNVVSHLLQNSASVQLNNTYLEITHFIEGATEKVPKF